MTPRFISPSFLPIIACGALLSCSDAQPQSEAPPTQVPNASSSARCDTPPGALLGGLRFALGDSGREPVKPWASVTADDYTYLAATLSGPGPRQVAIVRAESPDAAVNLRAVNGTARTFTDLQPTGPKMPKAAIAALACVDE